MAGVSSPNPDSVACVQTIFICICMRCGKERGSNPNQGARKSTPTLFRPRARGYNVYIFVIVYLWPIQTLTYVWQERLQKVSGGRYEQWTSSKIYTVDADVCRRVGDA